MYATACPADPKEINSNLPVAARAFLVRTLQMLDVLRESQPEQYADIMAQLQASAGGPAGAGVSLSKAFGTPVSVCEPRRPSLQRLTLPPRQGIEVRAFDTCVPFCLRSRASGSALSHRS